MPPEQEQNLLRAISQMLLPLISPYDLSEVQMMTQYYNNPRFYGCVHQIFHLITKDPETEAKILNDMLLMKTLTSINSTNLESP